ncbi:MAG: ATP-binding protein, partial [Oscillospiraceae bacterium]
MLQLIVGPAHSGKTGLLRARIQERARAGKRAVLLVPEQASFANEKALALLLGPDAARAQVLSFTRMAELLLRELGGAGRRAMNEAAAYLLMSVALDELSDELFVYKRHYQSRGFIEQMVATASEFSYAGISPAALSAFS